MCDKHTKAYRNSKMCFSETEPDIRGLENVLRSKKNAELMLISSLLCISECWAIFSQNKRHEPTKMQNEML